MKKFLTIILIIIMFSINIMPVFANSYKLNIEKESADIKYLENDQGYISKKIINSNPEKGEVTVDLSISNSNSTKVEESLGTPEIMIVVDNSKSMSFTTPNGKVRKTEILTAVRTLVDSIYATDSSAKIGLVRFAGYVKAGNYSCDSSNLVEGICTEDQDTFYYEGNDSSYLMQNLTNDKNQLVSAIDNLEKLSTPFNYGTEASTDIASGIKMAYNSFSETSNNKTIILITDGLPTQYLDVNYSSIQYSKTNKYIKSIASETNLVTVLTGITDEDSIDESKVIETFGTKEAPAADKYYNISDTDLSKTITEDLLNDVKQYIQPNMKNITITDYFPEDITENFEFSYITKPTSGTISETMDENNTIVYSLDELKGNESIKISYKLKLKDMNNSKLLDKVISTNEKVVLKYTDNAAVEHEVTLTSSPSIKLVKVEEEKEEVVETPVKPETPKEEKPNVEETVENPPTGLYFQVGALATLFIGVVGFNILKKKNYFSKV